MNYSEITWSATSSIPLLALLQGLPLALALAIRLAKNQSGLFLIGIGGSLFQLVDCVILFIGYNPRIASFQYAERLQLYGPFQYHAAVDGVGVMFALLTAFLTLMIVLYGHVQGVKPQWRFLVVVFMMEATLMFQFFSMDIILFVWGSVLQMLLVSTLLRHWSTTGGSFLHRIRYAQFMTISILLLLLGAGLLGWHHNQATGGLWSFDLIQLAQTPMNDSLQSVVFFLLFYGMAIRIPLFPLHGWLPDVAQHGMVAVVPIFLLGLKIGVFGILRFVLPLTPHAVLFWHQFVVAIAVTGIFYAAVLALMQANIRRLLAYAVISHTGIITIGLFSLEHRALEGAVLLSVNLGLATTGLLVAAGFVHYRTKTMFMDRLGGLFDHFPIIGSVFLISGLSIVCMPGTPGFDAVHLVLEAAIGHFGALVTILAALGNVVSAGFLLWAFHRTFLAKNQKDLKIAGMLAPRLQERAVAILVLFALLSLGLYSEPWIFLIERSLEGLGNLFQHAATPGKALG
ncbi:MAG: NADH-quinone oxidoreductase subunit M [Magnetococcales bacterium]|nr:NADH-quinone oxidoreductase subunit M [Magnetococcales bacterium]